MCNNQADSSKGEIKSIGEDPRWWNTLINNWIYKELYFKHFVAIEAGVITLKSGIQRIMTFSAYHYLRMNVDR